MREHRASYLPLRMRLFILAVLPLALGVIGTAVALSRMAVNTSVEQSTRDAVTLARVLGVAGVFAEEVPVKVEEITGQHMLAQAVILSHYVAAAEQAGSSPDEINRELRRIVSESGIEEIWVTDSRGHAYLHSLDGVDFTFSADASSQPQAHYFYPLLSGEATSVVQDVIARELDDKPYRYAGVTGVDQPRIVQVGHEASFFNRLTESVDPQSMLELLSAQPEVLSVRIVTLDGMRVQAAASSSGEAKSIDPSDAELLGLVRSSGEEQVRMGSILAVAAPMNASGTRDRTALLVHLSMDQVNEIRQRTLTLGLLVTAVSVLVGALLSRYLARQVTGPMSRLAELASAVERCEVYDVSSIEDLQQGRDELAGLSQVLGDMAKQVRLREEAMQRQLHDLRVEVDGSRKERDVAEITETEFFRRLRETARTIRESGEKEQ